MKQQNDEPKPRKETLKILTNNEWSEFVRGKKLEEGIKQGYAKAIDDVEKIFWEADELDFDSRYDEQRYIIEKIAKLKESK